VDQRAEEPRIDALLLARLSRLSRLVGAAAADDLRVGRTALHRSFALEDQHDRAAGLVLTYEIVLRRRLRVRDVAAMVPLLVCGAFAAWLNLHDNPSHGVAYHGGSFWVTLRTSATTIPSTCRTSSHPFSCRRTTRAAPRLVARPAGRGGPRGHPDARALTVELGRRGLPEAFWLVWFAATLAPMLNLVPFPALMNDRYLYLPLLGILVPLLRLVRRGLQRAGAERAAPVLAGATVALLAVLTIARVPVFHDELALWADFALRYSYISSDRPYGACSAARRKTPLERRAGATPHPGGAHQQPRRVRVRGESHRRRDSAAGTRPRARP
jgi:hypothetical protein